MATTYNISFNVNDVLSSSNKGLKINPEITDAQYKDLFARLDEYSDEVECLAGRIALALYPLNKWIVNKYTYENGVITFNISVQTNSADLKKVIEKVLTYGLLLEWSQLLNLTPNIQKYQSLLTANLAFITSVAGAIKTSSIRATLTS